MSSSRDDFGIAIRSALLKKGARQKFSLVFLLILAIIIFLLDIYQFKFIKITKAGFYESMVHSVEITKKNTSYKL